MSNNNSMAFCYQLSIPQVRINLSSSSFVSSKSPQKACTRIQRNVRALQNYSAIKSSPKSIIFASRNDYQYRGGSYSGEHAFVSILKFPFTVVKFIFKAIAAICLIVNLPLSMLVLSIASLSTPEENEQNSDRIALATFIVKGYAQALFWIILIPMMTLITTVIGASMFSVFGWSGGNGLADLVSGIVSGITRIFQSISL